jgi:hypothetical protein
MLLLLLSPQGAPPPSVALKVWLNVGGVWKLTTVYKQVAGLPKITTPAFNVSGTWK